MDQQHLESLTKLRGLSIGEIIIGILSLTFSILLCIIIPTKHFYIPFFFIVLNLIFITAGALGVHVVRKCRAGTYSQRSFTVLTGLNIFLAFWMTLFCIAIIILAVLVGVIRSVLEGMIAEVEKGFNIGDGRHRAVEEVFNKAHQISTVAIIVMSVILIVTFVVFFVLLIISAQAAHISRRNGAILKSYTHAVEGGYYEDNMVKDQTTGAIYSPKTPPPGYNYSYTPIKPELP